jgi:hypothetical protein
MLWKMYNGKSKEWIAAVVLSPFINTWKNRE